MEKENVRNEILNILKKFAPEVDIGNIDPQLPLREQFEIDSLDFVNFVIRIHEKFSVDIPESDYLKLRTLEEANQYIVEKMSKPEIAGPS